MGKMKDRANKALEDLERVRVDLFAENMIPSERYFRLGRMIMKLYDEFEDIFKYRAW